jgi:PAS domain S-box-containing protein
MTSMTAEETVRLNAERCHALITAVAEIVWTTDASGKVIEDQPAWRAFTGQSREEILGAGWLAALDPDSRQEAIPSWTRATARGLPYSAEWRLRRRDGEYRWFSIRAAPVRAGNAAVREWIGCNIDITHLRQHDEELTRLHAQADAAVAQLKRQAREIQILKNLGDTLQACNTREEAYPFIALAATELFPGARGALAMPAAGVRDMFATAIEWAGVSDGAAPNGSAPDKHGWMQADFALDDCWALRRGGLHEPGMGTTCQHFSPGAGEPHACVPLAVRGELFGLLSIRFAENKRLDEERRAALATFGNANALGLSTLQLREALHENPGPGASA